jgi:hypothetical protein
MTRSKRSWGYGSARAHQLVPTLLLCSSDCAAQHPAWYWKHHQRKLPPRGQLSLPPPRPRLPSLSPHRELDDRDPLVDDLTLGHQRRFERVPATSACRRFQMYCCLAPNDAQGHVWTAVHVSEQGEVASSGAAKCGRHIGFLRKRQPSVSQHFRLKKRLGIVCNCVDDSLSLNLASARDQRRHGRRG